MRVLFHDTIPSHDWLPGSSKSLWFGRFWVLQPFLGFPEDLDVSPGKPFRYLLLKPSLPITVKQTLHLAYLAFGLFPGLFVSCCASCPSPASISEGTLCALPGTGTVRREAPKKRTWDE